MSKYIFIDAGTVNGVHYVDVLSLDGNDPVDYVLPLDEAIRDYADNAVQLSALWPLTSDDYSRTN